MNLTPHSQPEGLCYFQMLLLISCIDSYERNMYTKFVTMKKHVRSHLVYLKQMFCISLTQQCLQGSKVQNHKQRSATVQSTHLQQLHRWLFIFIEHFILFERERERERGEREREGGREGEHTLLKYKIGLTRNSSFPANFRSSIPECMYSTSK